MRILLRACLSLTAHAQEQATPTLPATSEISDPALQTLVRRAREDGEAWSKLDELCTDIGHRLSGSQGLRSAVGWSGAKLKAEGLSKVWTEDVQVPHWVRGDESLTLLTPYPRSLALLGLGGTVGTEGLDAEVVVVDSWEALGPHVEGKIVLFNVVMPQGVPTARNYGATVGYRLKGADRASAHGAVGMLMRSITTRSLNTPHTGALVYSGGQPKIPGAAITTEDADLIARLVKRGTPVRVRLQLGAQTLPDAPSHNVIAEIPGRELPEEIVLIGAHLDSWDVGCGAHDDGSGIVEVMETMRLIAALPQGPKRTIRAVLFTNEENGIYGGKAYAEAHSGEQHIAAIECDLGGGRPLSWSASGSPTQLSWLRGAAEPLGLPVTEGGGGADIGPLKASGTLLIGLRPDDSHYFDIHHTAADTLDKVDPDALAEATAAVVSLVWTLANADR
jgi:carboxypeptidase Q